MPKKKSNARLTTRDKEIIHALKNKGNSVDEIAEFLEISKKRVEMVLKTFEPSDVLDTFKTSYQEKVEQIEDFERILQNKKDSADKGKEIWEIMKKKHVDYKASWEADSKATFNFKQRNICLALVADFHIGHEGVDLERLEQDLRLLAKTPNMYMAFLGDSIDNFIDLEHREAMINAVTSPKEQLYMLLHMFKNILKEPSHKILFATKDNHVTHRNKKNTGIDWSNKLWSDMNVFYGGEEVLATLNVGKVSYKLLARHKYRGKSNIHLTASCKNLLKNGRYEDVDIVGLAHTHEGAVENFSYRGRSRVACQTSTYKLFDPYAAKLGFDKPNIYMPCVILSPDEKEYVTCTSIKKGAEMITKMNAGPECKCKTRRKVKRRK